MTQALDTFGKRATALLNASIKTRPLHVKDIARESDMHSRRVRSILEDKAEPTVAEACAIAKSLEIPVNDLIYGIEEDKVDTETQPDLTTTALVAGDVLTVDVLDPGDNPRHGNHSPGSPDYVSRNNEPSPNGEIPDDLVIGKEGIYGM